jgi:hypothetical protein
VSDHRVETTVEIVAISQIREGIVSFDNSYIELNVLSSLDRFGENHLDLLLQHWRCGARH